MFAFVIWKCLFIVPIYSSVKGWISTVSVIILTSVKIDIEICGTW